MKKTKLTRDEFERCSATAKPIELFNQGIKAKATRQIYTHILRRIVCVMLEDILTGATFEERVEDLVRRARQNPAWGLNLMLGISRKLRERTELPHDHPDYYNPISVPNNFKPIKKLFEMNDVALPWKRVYATFPELDNLAETRGWTRGEIQDMLKFARGSMERAMVLVAASSGIRIGGFESLTWSDLQPIYRDTNGKLYFGKGGDVSDSGGDIHGEHCVNEHCPSRHQKTLVCAMLVVYARTSASYPAFITPEAYSAVMDYHYTWTKDVGRLPRPDEPLFKKAGTKPSKATLRIFDSRFVRMMRAAGLREPDRKNRRRFDVPSANGFRRFWNKTCKETASKDSPISSLVKKEYMMGHSGLTSLDRNYFKTNKLELAEEYLLSVPALTINDDARLQLVVRKQSEQIRNMEKADMTADIQKTISELSRLMEACCNELKSLGTKD